MKTHKLLAFLVAAVLLFSAVPVSFTGAAGEAPFNVPDSYNENDYMCCVNFLEQADVNGVKNGVKLSSVYDPEDPSTWGKYDDNGVQRDCFEFHLFGGEFRLVEIKANASSLVGVLDLSNCTELHTLNAVQNNIGGLIVTNCTKLKIINILVNSVKSLDVSTNYQLTDLGTADNPIDELDISHNPLLHNLFVGGGGLRELDLTHNPELPMQRVYALGSGTVSYMYLDLGIIDMLVLYPGALNGATFEGWFTEDGVLVDRNPEAFSVPDPWMYDVLVARYSGGETVISGDADGNGAVDALDALLVLRVSMGLASLPSAQAQAADVNGDGAVNANDALMILRLSMGLI